MGVLAFATWRSVIAALLIASAVLLMVRHGRARLVPFSGIPRLDRRQLVAVAALNTAVNLSIFAAFERTTIALVLICFYTYPVLVAVAATRLYGEHLDRIRLTALGLASSGMLLVVAAPLAGQDDLQVDALGMTLGLAAAVFQTGYALIAGRGFASLSASMAAAAISGLTATVTLMTAVALGAVGGLAAAAREPGAWPWILLAATIGSAIPTVAIIAGYRRVGPTRGSILMLFEPVIAVALAALLLAERPAPLQALGGVLVLVAAAVLQVAPTRAQLAAEGPPSV